MIRFANATGSAAPTNHTLGSVRPLAGSPRRILVWSPTCAVWVRFGLVATLAGVDVDTVTESATATDGFVEPTMGATEFGVPGSATAVAFRSAADPGGVVYCIPLLG